MTDGQLDLDVAPTSSEIKSALAEFVLRCVEHAGDVGVRKDEMVMMAREAGFFTDSTPDHIAKQKISWALNTAREFLEAGGQVVICDPQGGAEEGYRHRLALTEEEAFEEKQRRARKALSLVFSTKRAGDASVERFGENRRFYGSNEETIRKVFDRASRDAEESLRVMGSAWLTPNERPAKKRRGRQKVTAEEAQSSLL
jgi:hypothetical protein